MKFWDASALVALYAEEPRTTLVEGILRADRDAIIWWGTPVEFESAFRRLEREGRLTAAEVRQARRAFDASRRRWEEVVPSRDVRDQAVRLLAVHPLRAADALQLAAALMAAGAQPAELPVVSLDERLSDAAAREGLTVVPGP